MEMTTIRCSSTIAEVRMKTESTWWERCPLYERGREKEKEKEKCVSERGKMERRDREAFVSWDCEKKVIAAL